MLYNKHVPIAESALLVIDAQDSFKLGPRWELRDNKDFEKNVGRLVQMYRERGLPVFFFLHTDEDPGFERSSPHFRLMDFLSPLASEPLIPKTHEMSSQARASADEGGSSAATDRSSVSLRRIQESEVPPDLAP